MSKTTPVRGTGSATPAVRRLLALVCATAAAAAAAVGGLPPAAAGPAAVTAVPWFANQVGGAVQVVAVNGDESGQATVEGWEKSSGQWSDVTGVLPGWIGSAGLIQRVRDDVPATPVGVFSLPGAFGTDPSPSTALPYHRTSPNDWWVGDVKSRLYNTFATCKPGTCPFNENDSEQLDDDSYALAVVMGVNPRRIPGAGNAYFLHVASDTTTGGCVSIGKNDLLSLIVWLRPGAVIAVQSV